MSFLKYDHTGRRSWSVSDALGEFFWSKRKSKMTGSRNDAERGVAQVAQSGSDRDV